MEPRISLITLGVDDLQKSIDFYEKGLGWKRSSASQDDTIFLQLGNLVLGLYPRHLLAEDAQLPNDRKGFSGITLSYNTLSQKEVDDFTKKVEQLGAVIVKHPQKVFWGGYHSYFKDPSGYLFEIAYNPFFKFDDKHNLVLP